MAHPLKFVVLGTTALEVGELLGSMAQVLGGTQVTGGEAAGSQVYRFSCEGESKDDQLGSFTVYGASIECDFRGTLSLLMKNAAGVVGVIPADLSRADESRKVLSALYRAIQAKRKAEKEFPFAIQYHWAQQGGASSPEELDKVLGIDPEVAERVLSRAGGDEAGAGVQALIESLQRLKLSPK